MMGVVSLYMQSGRLGFQIHTQLWITSGQENYIYIIIYTYSVKIAWYPGDGLTLINIYHIILDIIVKAFWLPAFFFIIFLSDADVAAQRRGQAARTFG